MIGRRVTRFCKLAIFWAVIGLSTKFTVTVLKCGSDDKQSKNSWK